MYTIDKSACFKKGGRRNSSINTFNSYYYYNNNKYYRTIKCIEDDLKFSRRKVYKLLNNYEILKIKKNI